MIPTITIVATCDTKGNEVLYLKNRIEECSLNTLIIDTGILGDPIKILPDISKDVVAKKAGTTIEELKIKSRGDAVKEMCKGINILIGELHKEGRIQGLLSIGGAEGAIIGASAIDALPIGFPKIIVSPIASGNHRFKEIIHYNDAIVMHSVVDILGINFISKKIFDNAVGAIIGMINIKKEVIEDKEQKRKRIAVSMMGTVTKPIMRVVMPRLEKLGYEVIPFHANGTGGICMDNFIREGYFDGSIEYATNEISGSYLGGLDSCSKDRMNAAMEKNIPTIVTPGTVDFLDVEKSDEFADKYKNRPKYHHNPEITLIRLSADEMKFVGKIFAEKLNKSRGNVKFIYPKQGFSSEDKKGLSLWHPEGNEIFLKELKLNLRKDIEVIEINAHINDDKFANVVVDQLISLIKKNDLKNKNSISEETEIPGSPLG
jgi:uncharacterized protein (UPF0261 family)